MASLKYVSQYINIEKDTIFFKTRYKYIHKYLQFKPDHWNCNHWNVCTKHFFFCTCRCINTLQSSKSEAYKGIWLAQ